MARVPFITDWGFSDEVTIARPLVAVGLFFRTNRRHHSFLKRIQELADLYEHEVAFRLVDLGENPSLVGRLALTKSPALILLSHGAPIKPRWEGRIDFDEVEETLEQLHRTLGETG